MSSCLFPLILLRYPVTTQLSKQLGQRSRGEEVYKSICSLHKLQLYGNKLVRPQGFCIMFGTSFGEEKAYAWNERFGFEFLCVIFFVCVFLIMVVYWEGHQGFETQSSDLMLGYIKDHCTGRSLLPLQWKLLSLCKTARFVWSLLGGH